MSSSTFILIGLCFVAVTFVANLIVCFFDEIRIKSHLAARGGRLLVCAWSPAGNLPIFLAFRRTYEVTYLDASGQSHDATCTISVVFRIKFANDSVVSDSSPESDMKRAAIQTIFPPTDRK